MRRVKRPSRHRSGNATVPLPADPADIPNAVSRDSRDWPHFDRDIRTLTKRVRALAPGESLYPWAHCKMGASKSSKWIAKAPDEV